MPGGSQNPLGVDGELEALAQDLELVDGGGAVDVGGDEERVVALLHEEAGELADGGGFAGALEADQHDPGRLALLRAVDARLDGPHHVDQLALADGDEMIDGGDADGLALGLGLELDDLADGLGLDAIEELLGDVVVDVGLEQRQADVAQGLVDDLGGQLRLPGQPRLGGSKAASQRLEHRGRFLLQAGGEATGGWLAVRGSRSSTNRTTRYEPPATGAVPIDRG